MTRIVKHLLVPAIAPALIVGLYLTPVTVVGCVNRGIAAFAIVLVSLIAGLVMAIRALMARRRADARWTWWALTALILSVPAVLVLGPLG